MTWLSFSLICAAAVTWFLALDVKFWLGSESAQFKEIRFLAFLILVMAVISFLL